VRNSNHRLKIGYVLKVFPRLSETFVLNEILALEAKGVAVEIFSLNPPNDARFHGSLSRLRAGITYLPRGDFSEVWRTLRSEHRPFRLDPARIGEVFLRTMESNDPAAMKQFQQALALVAAVRGRGIIHLHAHFATSATHAAMLAHRLCGVNFSFTAHAKDIYAGGLDLAFLEEALERAAFAVTVTDYNVARLEEISPLARAKVHRIYNGMPLDSLDPKASPQADPPMIVSVGRLVEKKGFPYLIEACRVLRDRGQRFQCAIIGAGDRERELRRMITELDVESNVELLGALSHDAVLHAIARSSVVTLPCVVGDDGNRDALPTVLLEAMALARPAVSTNLEGITEIVDHGETGFLVPQRDSLALADSLQRLLADADLRRRFGAAARHKAERVFDLSRNVARLADLFENAAAEPSAVGLQAIH
jgi:glycosyltransferase involved in cell wall biosynthesis